MCISPNFNAHIIDSSQRLYFMFSNHLRLWPASDNPEKECRGQSFCLDFWLQWSQWPGLQGPEGKVGGGVQQEAQHLLRAVRVPLWRGHHPEHEARWVHRHIHSCRNRNCLWSWGRHSKYILYRAFVKSPYFKANGTDIKEALDRVNFGGTVKPSLL